MRLDALAQVCEFIQLAKTQKTGGLRGPGGDSGSCVAAPVSPHVLDSFSDERMTDHDDQLADLLQDAMDQLPDDVRDIVEAHVHQGLGVRRISRLPYVEYERTAVHDRLRSGLEQLHALLQDHPLIKDRLR